MRFVSPVALGLMLGLASVSMSAPTVAVAKEKAPPAPKLSAEVTKPLVAAQEALKAKNFEAAKTALDQADAVAKTPADKYFVHSIRLNLGLATSDAAVQRTSIEGMIASGGAPAAELPKYEFFAGDFAMKAKDYDAAIAHFKTAADGGYPGSAPWLLGAEANFQKAVSLSSNNQISPAGKPFAAAGLPLLKRAIEIEKAAGTAIPASWYNRGFSMAYASGSPDSRQWGEWNTAADPSPNNWRSMLRSYQDANRQMTRGENLDVLRLLKQTKGLLAEYDYGEYADLAQKAGLLGEVKSTIDAGRASGKVAPNRLTELYQMADTGIAKDKASLPASEADASKAATGKVAVNTADAYLGYGDYAKAAALYRVGLQKGSVDVPEVTTRLAIALALSGDTAGAKENFAKVTGGTRGDIARYWVMWLDQKPAA
ncbi:hypothetical protein [Sphingobium subterraneum]|uniref:Tetratricopeptide (TPR) repeat protein n=1 Tax=Sphingobium subterraneum TaxID=627688 RepID=A0A841J135_9SPHN|nr:hypothetical protein [Sphingobium subterraneum]MBB6123236.1 tetratricopeptide (TPR) repeat protein [Sphingobium subterraneum]